MGFDVFIYSKAILVLLISCGILLGGCKNKTNIIDGDRNFKRGVAYFNSNDFEKSLILLKGVKSGNKNYENARIIIAKDLFYLKRYGKAISVLEGLVRDYPENFNALYWLGKLYFFTGNYDRAEVYLLKVGDNDSYNIDAIFLLAEVYREKGDYQRALNNYEKLGSYYDLFVLSKLRKAQIFLESGQIKDAEVELKFARTSMPFISEDLKRLTVKLISHIKN